MYKMFEISLNNESQKNIGSLQSLTQNKVSVDNLINLSATELSAGLVANAYISGGSVYINVGSKYTVSSIVCVMISYI